MGPIDIGVHRRETIIKTFREKILRGQVIALVKFYPTDDVKYAG